MKRFGNRVRDAKEQKRLLSYFNKLNQESKDAIIVLYIVYVRDQARKNTFQ